MDHIRTVSITLDEYLELVNAKSSYISEEERDELLVLIDVLKSEINRLQNNMELLHKVASR